MSDYEDDDGDLFSSNRVRELNNEDFALESTEGLTLFAEGCSIVLFYTTGGESAGIADLMGELSEQFLDVNFFGVNLSQRRDIAKRIGQIRNDPNHMFYRFSLARAPYIIVFRESMDPQVSYPQAFYSGQYETEAMAEWITTLACLPGYTDYSFEGSDSDVEEYVPRSEARPQKSSVARVMSARQKEMEAYTLSSDDYEQMTPVRDLSFKLNKRSGPSKGVGFVSF